MVTGMNEKSSDKDRLSDDEKLTARLMRIAGPRAEIPPDIESRVYDRVLDEWTADNQRSSQSGIYQDVEKSWRRRQLRARHFRWIAPILVAASAAYIVINMSEPDALPAPAVGTIAMTMGANTASRWSEGQALHAGETITTGAGQGLSILMAGKESLRLDQNSILKIDGREQFTLLQGRVYADTGQLMYRDGGLIISAGFATVTDVGTQFAVALEDSELLVSVREGRVDIGHDAGAVVAVAGERVRVTSDGDALSETLATDAPDWQWAASLAPTFEIENRSLMEFLSWASRETGLRLEFSSDELRMAAMRTDIHGSVVGFSPADAIPAVMATTTFKYRIEKGAIYISR